MSEADKTLAGAIEGVTGKDSPDNAQVHRPASGAVAALFVALAIACVSGGAGICALTFAAWPESAAALRIHFLGWTTILSIGCIPVVVIAFSTPWIGRISASAGTNSFSVEARDD